MDNLETSKTRIMQRAEFVEISREFFNNHELTRAGLAQVSDEFVNNPAFGKLQNLLRELDQSQYLADSIEDKEYANDLELTLDCIRLLERDCIELEEMLINFCRDFLSGERYSLISMQQTLYELERRHDELDRETAWLRHLSNDSDDSDDSEGWEELDDSKELDDKEIYIIKFNPAALVTHSFPNAWSRGNS